MFQFFHTFTLCGVHYRIDVIGISFTLCGVHYRVDVIGNSFTLCGVHYRVDVIGNSFTLSHFVLYITGLTLLVPYILQTKQQWKNCGLRVFTAGTKRGELVREQKQSVLVQFIITLNMLTTCLKVCCDRKFNSN